MGDPGRQPLDRAGSRWSRSRSPASTRSSGTTTLVTTLEVVQHLTPISARTWVRRDGLVLRQEVPFPFVKLILERLPDRAERGQARGPSSMIELRGVTKTFGSKRAVDHLDLSVRAGELFAFLGPNGAGKTTTIKMVCGLLRPTSGRGPGRRLPRRQPRGPPAHRLRPRPALPLREAHRPRVPPVRRRDVRPRAPGRRPGGSPSWSRPSRWATTSTSSPRTTRTG